MFTKDRGKKPKLLLIEKVASYRLIKLLFYSKALNMLKMLLTRRLCRYEPNATWTGQIGVKT